MTPDEVVKAIVASGIEYDQVIREFDRWTHISIPNSINFSPRGQALIIDKAGTRPYA
jgi:sugar lactone lactonase YvrE